MVHAGSRSAGTARSMGTPRSTHTKQDRTAQQRTHTVHRQHYHGAAPPHLECKGEADGGDVSGHVGGVATPQPRHALLPQQTAEGGEELVARYLACMSREGLRGVRRQQAA